MHHSDDTCQTDIAASFSIGTWCATTVKAEDVVQNVFEDIFHSGGGGDELVTRCRLRETLDEEIADDESEALCLFKVTGCCSRSDQ